MSKSTTRLVLPYPEDTDAPDGAAQIKALADRLDLVVPKLYTPKIIATEQSRNNESFGLLGTPDEIPSVVVPTDGLLLVGYSASVKSANSGAARAAIFLGANQLKIAPWTEGTAPIKQEAEGNVGILSFSKVFSTATGLRFNSVGAYSGDVTTGQLIGANSASSGVGGMTAIFAAAGTYNVSVQYRAGNPGGEVWAKERKLWVAVLGAS